MTTDAAPSGNPDDDAPPPLTVDDFLEHADVILKNLHTTLHAASRTFAACALAVSDLQAVVLDYQAGG